VMGGKILFIGGLSPSARYFVSHYQKTHTLDIFTSRTTNDHRCYRYEQYDTLRDNSYEKIYIFSSGVPSFCSTKEDYIEINTKIKNIINSIDLENSEIIFLSSYSVYPKDITYIDQDTKCNPQDFYGLAKVEMEDFLIQKQKETCYQLRILRLPVYLYKGVKNNFLAANMGNLKAGKRIILSNPTAIFNAVIDDESLFRMVIGPKSPVSITNCCSNGDITFEELAEIFLSKGARNIEWKMSGRPSVKVVPTVGDEHLVSTFSTRKIIKEWMQIEINSTL
jgi:nucleoside-diphosphate-sugar epimerase